MERAIGLLDAFEQQQSELRVSELVGLTGLGQSTVSRLLATLEAAGFVEHDPRSNLYRIGGRVIALAALALNQNSIFREARQIAQTLACDTGLGANVAELTRTQLRYLCHFEGELAPRSFTMIGREIPLHATGLGKAVLSTLDRETVETLTPAGSMTGFTRNTLTDHVALHASLDEIRDRGYATEVEELAFGRACVAAPILNRRRETVAGLSLSGSLSALDLGRRQRELGLRVVEAADKVSVALGHSTPAPLP